MGDKYYVVYPAMPAVLMIPFVAILGNHFSQTMFAAVLGAVDVVLVYWLVMRLNLSRLTAILVSLFFGLGTNLWYLSSIGSAWYIAHNVGLLFLLLSLIEVLGRRRWWLIGLLMGLSFWARTTIIFGGIFFLINYWREFWPLKKVSVKNWLQLGGGVGLLILIDSWYNYIRFNNPSPLSPYQLIPNLDQDPMFKDGFMSWQFIPRHLEAVFWKLPVTQPDFPWLLPSLLSLAVWFTSPALLLVLKVKPSRLMWSCWVAVGMTFGVIMTWAGVGYSQFGYRFAQDFMPFLLILLAVAIGSKPRWYVYVLIGLSILVNLWGVVMLNHYNLYGW